MALVSPYKSFARGSSSTGPAASFPPPTYVKYLPLGEIKSAWQSAETPHGRASRASGVRRLGLAYQRRVEQWAFEGSWSGAILVSPWLCFVDESEKRHYCQPDLVFDDGTAMIVVETKLRWTADAWWQLRKLYLPVLAKIFPRDPIVPLCVCKSYDPSVVAPEAIEVRRDLYDCKPNSFNLLVVR